MDRHDTEIVIGTVYVSSQKLEGVLKVSCPDTARLVNQEVDRLVFVASDGD